MAHNQFTKTAALLGKYRNSHLSNDDLARVILREIKGLNTGKLDCGHAENYGPQCVICKTKEDYSG